MTNNKLRIEEAITIAKKYIINIDPNTGEVLDELNKIDDLLAKALKTLTNPDIDELKKLLNIKCGYPPRRGFKWSNNEDLKLIEGFNKGTDIKQIVKAHERSLTAIYARLKHLKLVDHEVEFPRTNYRNTFSISY